MGRFKRFAMACALLLFAGSHVHAQTNGINYGHAGGWFNTATPGQGFLIDLEPSSQFIFIPWFTFDVVSPQAAGQISGAEQRWYTAQGNYSGNTANLTLFVSTGGILDNPQMVNTVAVGSLSIVFDTCTQARLAYQFNNINLSGQISLTKLLADEICTLIQNGQISMNKQADTPVVAQKPLSSTEADGDTQNINYGLIGGWFDPGASGQGLMFDFALNNNFMFVAWFTFDSDGVPDGSGTLPGDDQRWFTAQGNYSGNRADLQIFQTRNGVIDNPATVDTQAVGTMVVEFETCTQAHVQYNMPTFNLSGQIAVTKLLGDVICSRINSGDIVIGPVQGSAPTFTSSPATTVTAGSAYSYSITTQDADGNARSISAATALPAWLNLVDNGNGTGSLSGTPSAQDVGTVNVSLRVTDTTGLSTTQSFSITVSGQTSNNASVSGRITYDRVPVGANGLNYCSITQQPARGVLVRALDGSNNVLAATSTNGNGDYLLELPSNQTVTLQVVAAMIRSGTPSWDFRVVDNTSNQSIYAMTSSPFNSGSGPTSLNLNAQSGFSGDCNNVGNFAYGGPRVAAPFAILDGVYQSYQKVLAVDPSVQFPALLINWSVNNVPTDGDNNTGQIGTSNFSGGQLWILGADGNDTDEYDDHVIIHEWGHYFEAALSRSDSIGGPHGAGDRLDPRVAFGEGFGNALSGMVTDDPLYQDSAGSGNGQRAVLIDVEKNDITNPGWYNEGSVESILYDLYDATNEPGDSITLGFGPLYQVMRNEQRQTPVLTTIFSFISALKAGNQGSAGAIDSLVANQQIQPVADIYGSSETNNAGNADVLPVYTATAADGRVVNVCSIQEFGTFNKLSNRRFVDFSLEQDANVTITMTPTGGTSNDAAFRLFRNGAVVSSVDQFAANGAETLTMQLNAGAYIIEAFEFQNLGDSGGGRNCFDIKVTTN